MPESHRKNLKNLELRAKLPRVLRSVALGAIGLTIVVLVFSWFWSGSKKDFRMKGFPTSLSKDVIAEIGNYERTETDGEIRKYYIRASKATTFADNHQELENVYLEVYDDTGSFVDKISADRGVYLPEAEKNFTAYFAGGVNIETRDSLRIKTDQVTYRKASEIAEAEELVEFERENISGRSIGAVVKIREKRLELMKQVEIDAFALDPKDAVSRSDLKSARITADSAVVDQTESRIELSENVFVGIIPNGAGDLSQPTDIHSSRAVVGFIEREIRTIELSGGSSVYQKPTAANQNWSKTKSGRASAEIDRELKRIELFENVEIEAVSGGARPTRITSGYALYDRPSDRYDLRENVHIVTIQDERLTNIRSAQAVYEQSSGRIGLSGGAEIDNGREFVRGSSVNAELFADKSVKSANASGAAYLRQTTAERTIEVTADELSAVFGESRQLVAANAVGRSDAVLIPADKAQYSRVTMSAPRAIRLMFRGAGALAEMKTDGRTTILMNAPDNSPDAANKRLTADSVRSVFDESGKNLRSAEAVGNGELIVEPLRPGDDNYRTTINAPRFDCEFFATGNNAKNCIAQTKTRTIRVPTIRKEGRGDQVMLADKLTADFNPGTQDIDRLEAVGGTKFTELDRNGTAAMMSYSASEKIVRMRGGEPTVWDSRARAKADEIDWKTGDRRSFLNGNVSTAYYNQKQTGGATPFTQSNKPVFVTSANAEFDHVAETGLYTGNARAWQETNFVRADRILVRQREGQLFAEGAVQSAVYETKNADRKSPVFASSRKLAYDKNARTLRYEGDVDIRQGTDRVTAGLATVLLDENNEMRQTTVEENVIITQPKRRATGTWAQYTNTTEIAVLRGNPAVVEDAESGSTQGAQLTVNNRENRITNESKTSPASSGRIRSVYKVKKN